SGPGELNAGSGDPVGKLFPRTFGIVAYETIECIRINHPAPLHGPAKPNRVLPTRRAINRNRAVRTDSLRGWIDQINKRHAGPPPVNGLIEKFLFTGQLEAQRVSAHKVRRGKNVRRV